MASEKKRAWRREYERKIMADPEKAAQRRAYLAAYRKNRMAVDREYRANVKRWKDRAEAKARQDPEYLERRREQGRAYVRRKRREDVEYKKRRMVDCACYRAKKIGLEGAISAEQIVWPTHCPVFPWIELDYSTSEKKKPNSPSLDRVDNSKGYIVDNVRVISWRANELKSNATHEELRRLAQYVSEIRS